MPRIPADLHVMDALLRAGDAPVLAAAIAAGADAPLPHVAAMVACVLAPEGRPETLGLPPLEEAFVRVAAAALRLGAAAPPPGRIGPELDGLERDHGPASWSAGQFLAQLCLRTIKPTRRAAVVTMVRDEGLALLEFVAHYRALGFEAIYV